MQSVFEIQLQAGPSAGRKACPSPNCKTAAKAVQVRLLPGPPWGYGLFKQCAWRGLVPNAAAVVSGRDSNLTPTAVSKRGGEEAGSSRNGGWRRRLRTAIVIYNENHSFDNLTWVGRV